MNIVHEQKPKADGLPPEAHIYWWQRKYTQFKGGDLLWETSTQKIGAHQFMAFDRHGSLSEDRLLREYSSELMTLVVFILNIHHWGNRSLFSTLWCMLVYRFISYPPLRTPLQLKWKPDEDKGFVLLYCWLQDLEQFLDKLGPYICWVKMWEYFVKHWPLLTFYEKRFWVKASLGNLPSIWPSWKFITHSSSKSLGSHIFCQQPPNWFNLNTIS